VGCYITLRVIVGVLHNTACNCGVVTSHCLGLFLGCTLVSILIRREESRLKKSVEQKHRDERMKNKQTAKQIREPVSS
jgi:hypothetical protein